MCVSAYWVLVIGVVVALTLFRLCEDCETDGGFHTMSNQAVPLMELYRALTKVLLACGAKLRYNHTLW